MVKLGRDRPHYLPLIEAQKRKEDVWCQPGHVKAEDYTLAVDSNWLGLFANWNVGDGVWLDFAQGLLALTGVLQK